LSVKPRLKVEGQAGDSSNDRRDSVKAAAFFAPK